jgi:RNA polymerase sigma-70 factor (ECF subfamily)
MDGKAGRPMSALALAVRPRLNLLRGFWLIQDDSTLAKLVLRGDSKAEEELISRHYAQVYRVAYGILCEHHIALDVSQDLFARMGRLLRRYDGRSALKSYLYRAAANAALDELRRRKRRCESAQVEELQPPAHNGSAGSLEVTEVIRLALAELPPRQRAAVVLRDMQGLGTEEAAASLGITASGLRTLLAEGRLRLKQVIEKRYPEFKDWSG